MNNNFSIKIEKCIKIIIIFRTIETAINTVVGCKKKVNEEKHGSNVVSFELDDNLFLRGQTYKEATQAKIVVTKAMILNYFNEHLISLRNLLIYFVLSRVMTGVEKYVNERT